MLSKPQAVLRALARPRFEVVPLKSLDDELGVLSTNIKLTVTCSPARGIEPTIALTCRLAAAGFSVVPHLAARAIPGEAALNAILMRLDEAAVDEVYVIGGDAAEIRGPYATAPDLLAALSRLRSSITSVGVGAYPEHHPLMDESMRTRVLLEKQAFATYMVTQICFEPTITTAWLETVRHAGVTLPVYIGVPGILDTAHLLRMSLKIGVGDSVRFLSKQHGLASHLLGRGGYSPAELIAGLAPALANRDLGILGLHFNTFNQLARLESWSQQMLQDSAVSHEIA